MIRSSGGAAAAVRADVSRSKDVARVVEKTLSIFDGIDILINIATDYRSGQASSSGA